jgi:acyl carrier protein
LDSINLVRLVQFLEERFGIQIPEGDLGPELFETPASVTAYVQRRAA